MITDSSYINIYFYNRGSNLIVGWDLVTKTVFFNGKYRSKNITLHPEDLVKSHLLRLK